MNRSGAERYVPSATDEQAWAEARIGACAEHSWQPTGCWYTWRAVGCTKLSAEHSLWKALAKLDVAHANLLAHRFADLSKLGQIELWRTGNRTWCGANGEAEIARAVSEAAGWSDLAAFYSR